MRTDEIADRFDRELDALATNGRLEPASSGELVSLLVAAEATRALDAADVDPDPDPDFLHHLEETLAMNAPDRIIAAPLAFSPVYHAPEPVAIRSKRDGGRLAWLEFAAAALLIFVLAGTAYGGGAFDRFLPAVATPIPAATTGVTGMYRGDAGRTGAVPGYGPTGAPVLAWKNPVYAAYGNPPVVAGDRIFFFEQNPTTKRSYVTCLDVETGTKVWSQQVDVGSTSAPAVGGNLVFATTSTGLVALNSDTGARVWSFDAGGHVLDDAPAYANGVVYFSNYNLKLYAVDAVTGKQLWWTALPYGAVGDANAVDSGTRGFDAPSVADGIVVAVGGNGYVMAADVNDGHELWRLQASASTYPVDTPVISDGVVYLEVEQPSGAGQLQGGVLALDAGTGTILWSLNDQPRTLGLAIDSGALFITQGGKVGAYNTRSGGLIWSFLVAGGTSEPIVAGGIVYVQTSEGELYGLNADGGQRLWEAYAGSTGDPTVVDGKVIVSGDASLYAIGGDSSTILPASGNPALDVSGLAPCSPWRTGAAPEIGGTLSAKLDAAVRLPNVSGTLVREILIKDLPSGKPASADDLSGIEETLQKMTACADRPEASGQLIGFYTDDYFRRITAPGGKIEAANRWPLAGNRAPVVITSTVVLPDQRVAALAMDSETTGTLLIFAKQDGHWLIDERYHVVANYTTGGVG